MIRMSASVKTKWIDVALDESLLYFGVCVLIGGVGSKEITWQAQRYGDVVGYLTTLLSIGLHECQGPQNVSYWPFKHDMYSTLHTHMMYTRLKKAQEKDKIESKPDKNGKRGEAGK
nr:hypothetical protein [Tanacetum cinerariifolium]